MADTNNASLPPPPAIGAAPGQPGYENGSQTHMPPPPVPSLTIPPNTNPIPTAVNPGSAISPTSAGGLVRRAAPEPNKRALYVGGLDPRVTEDVLKQIFETTGHVQNVKIIPDKNSWVSLQLQLSLPSAFAFAAFLLLIPYLSVYHLLKGFHHGRHE